MEYHNHLIRYFNEKVGYPADQGVISESGVPAVGDKVPAVEEKNPVNKVNDAAKNAMGKVKGLLKKKK
ncbi:MAG: hypothetical protein ACI37U_01565 [Bacteroides sp.]